jgi:FlaA1/EpsC-like NDP-sugar epimerase
MPSAGSEIINRMVTHIRSVAKNISIKTLPSIIELLGKRTLIGSLRSISIDDLIGREEVKVDVAGIEKNFKDKVVLVTGAGGSIGAEICKQLLNFKIKKLIAIDRSEFLLYTLIKNIQRDMGYLGYKPDIIFRVIDIKDSHPMDKVFSETRPDTVFHAAAHKHVPLMEYNETEAFRNNVGGTLQLLKLCKQHKVDKFVLVSTDKSVYPVSVMGVTKRIAELITLYYHNEKGLPTAIVRFGNVIGSRGSVVPLFQEQIKSGGPVTVTHPDMKRFFMTIPEASILVINASVYSKGGEIFVLDMGKQHSVLDIAKNLIRFYGYEPGKDIEIVFTGLRPGEKLYEELFYKRECMRETENEKILILDSRGEDYNKATIENFLGMDLGDIYGYDAKSIRCFMKRFVAEYDFNNLHERKDDSSKLVN